MIRQIPKVAIDRSPSHLFWSVLPALISFSPVLLFLTLSLQSSRAVLRLCLCLCLQGRCQPSQLRAWPGLLKVLSDPTNRLLFLEGRLKSTLLILMFNSRLPGSGLIHTSLSCVPLSNLHLCDVDPIATRCGQGSHSYPGCHLLQFKYHLDLTSTSRRRYGPRSSVLPSCLAVNFFANHTHRERALCPCLRNIQYQET